MRIFVILLLLTGMEYCYGQNKRNEYSLLVQGILAKRDEFKSMYVNSDSAEKASALNEARVFLDRVISKDIFPYWYGTNWDYNGTTRIPNEGKIACGYFVTNILTDVGFNIPRIKWAQSASEVFIVKLAHGNVKRFTNRPIVEIEKHLQISGNGVYLVGLDTHVGFLVVESTNISFIHSNYYQPHIGVMSEKINSRNPLNDSNYRIIGKLMTDEMIIKWLFNQAYD